MKDLIDERNEKERIRKSIVKFWNVNYIPKSREEMALEMAEKNCHRPEDEVNDLEKQEQIEAGLREAAQQDSDYNETTGAYSGSYGRSAEQVDDVTKGQIDQILMEKTNMLRNIIASEGGDPS